ncbi:MAG: hypothetical protein CMK09_17970 [Ponticaulis sp.]|nr:hypothetical protein [Ponticaulis sp.]|tara:strand:- start:21946 stop:22296 length:351 start_codon:yes stop_codon:yes gene_type:complete
MGMVAGMVLVSAIVFSPIVVNVIWGAVCWTERRLFFWLMTNFGVAILLRLSAEGAFKPDDSMVYRMMEFQLMTFIPLALLQMIISLVRRNRANGEQRREQERTHLITDGQNSATGA